MAGKGSRFQKEGYLLPKPLIEIYGKSMIEVVINNLRPKSDYRFIFICLREHVEQYQIDEILRKIEPGCEIRIINDVTEGAACTVLLAKSLINDSNPLMIANCDQWVDIDINKYVHSLDENNTDGLIMTMWADDPKWSFVRLDSDGKVTEVVEKQVVSNEATVGIYNFKRGQDFIRAAEKMIEKDLRVNNEFYVAPAYNELIHEGYSISLFNVGKENDGMYGLGIPKDLEFFINHPLSKKATNY
jgi:NDP-sugar pyrophosphorylase family protein